MLKVLEICLVEMMMDWLCNVYALFNKQKRKFRNRAAHRKRRKVDSRVVETEVKNQMILYKSPGFTFSFRTYFMNLPRNKLRVVVNVNCGETSFRWNNPYSQFGTC